MRKEISIKKTLLSLGAMTALIFGQSCSDLDPQFSDSVSNASADGDFAGVSDVSSALTALYDNIENMGDQANEYALMEVSAENVAVLTRGADWGDNGVWRLLHNHTWNGGHLYVLNAWNNRNQEILNATRLLDPASGAPAGVAAQARVIRAINMFMVLNFYGQVPFRGVNDGADVNPEVLTPQAAFDFVLDDLNTAISSGQLHTSGPVATGDPLQFVLGEAAARFIRAKVNLNSASILGAAPAGAMDAVIADVDAIEALGFELDLVGPGEDYFDIWRPDSNSEVIYYMNTGTGNRVLNMIHPNQSGWNGFVTLTETYRLFGSDDVNDDARLGLAGPDFDGVSTGYLRGQQLDGDGNPLTDRQNAPLVYEDELLTSLEINNERTGIRVVKYPQRGPEGTPNGFTNSESVWLRLSEAYLMRAEAALRGGSGGNADADINALRNRAGATPLGSVSLQDVYDEYKREMNAEANIAGMRAVQVRFGTFAETWELKNVQDDFRVLFPIPTTALASNPNLVQNPGY